MCELCQPGTASLWGVGEHMAPGGSGLIPSQHPALPCAGAQGRCSEEHPTLPSTGEGCGWGEQASLTWW